ncbi:MAG: L-threonylcarbamoyladenylate synthase [Coriobacteriaceae bacterium]|nr:L-threonylcarbamoyladenylate synthase [Coriobacteriaceae bacterium]
MTNVLRSHDDVTPAIDALRAGALVLVPTETVYGVGVAVAAFSECETTPGPDTGYGRIFTLKQREVTQTVPWLVEGPSALDRYGRDVPAGIRRLADVFWPGALTLVVPASDQVPSFMRAADGTVALRMSSSPVVQRLIQACGSPLAVTSANTHGKPAPASFADVEERILEGVDVAIDAGATPCRDASTIVAVRDGEAIVLREGAINAQKIAEAL